MSKTCLVKPTEGEGEYLRNWTDEMEKIIRCEEGKSWEERKEREESNGRKVRRKVGTLFQIRRMLTFKGEVEVLK